MRSSIEGLIFIFVRNMGPKKMQYEQMRSGTISALLKSSCNRNGGHDFSSDESILEKQTIQILEALLNNQNIMACKLYTEPDK